MALAEKVAARFLTFNPSWLVVLSHTPHGWLLTDLGKSGWLAAGSQGGQSEPH